MFSKNEAKLLRQEFWTSFGKSFPRNGFCIIPMLKGLVLNFILIPKPPYVAFCIDMDPDNKSLLGTK